jgi:ketosteroid isomerase-like protein
VKVVASLLAATAIASPAGSAAMPQDLARAVAAYDTATVSSDVARLDAIVRDDYLLVNSDMSVQRKASYLADFKAAGFKIDRYRLSDPILIVRADSALTGGHVHLSWTQGGQRFDRNLRIIHFWVKDRGRWQLAYTQLTRQPVSS